MKYCFSEKNPPKPYKSHANKKGKHFFRDYQDRRAIEKFMKSFVDNRTDFYKVTSLRFPSHMSRYIYEANINSNSKTKNPVIVITAGEYGKDWTAISTALYLIKFLLNKRRRKLVVKYRWLIVPLLNPDGYHWSRTYCRQWQKNAGYNWRTGAFGVNLGRNWDDHWKENPDN